jgi:RecJ-like exonuclease
MKTKFTKECKTCCGSGSVTFNDSFDEHPSRDYSFDCKECEGEGHIIDEAELWTEICNVEDMIDGMITRIRTTSDTLKDLSKGMFYELLPKYKNILNTQARALARLESYCANLKTQMP